MTLDLVLRESYLRERPADAAQTIENMPVRDLHEQLEGLSAEGLVSVLEFLTNSRAMTVFEQLDAGQQQGILEAASPRLALTLLDGMDASTRDSLFEGLPG